MDSEREKSPKTHSSNIYVWKISNFQRPVWYFWNTNENYTFGFTDFCYSPMSSSSMLPLFHNFPFQWKGHKFFQKTCPYYHPTLRFTFIFNIPLKRPTPFIYGDKPRETPHQQNTGHCDMADHSAKAKLVHFTLTELSRSLLTPSLPKTGRVWISLDVWHYFL